VRFRPASWYAVQNLKIGEAGGRDRSFLNTLAGPVTTAECYVSCGRRVPPGGGNSPAKPEAF
jgi:hypothetical protein